PLTGWSGSASNSAWAAMTSEAMGDLPASLRSGPPVPAGAESNAPVSAAGAAPQDLSAPAMSALHQLLDAARQASATGLAGATGSAGGTAASSGAAAGGAVESPGVPTAASPG